ncbi:hypothetical protein C4D60_Mb08t03300 [Musa balbisiana]|uniref:Uncharacterized protein n=1 Tax=Musa balbisiana TaxID=52838 RepID=A0A4S8K0Y8_MUSBA|nr:hypothetical protein C4D60_Mb08t03300 [Musa balbisiana]
MVSAENMTIIWGYEYRYWRWVPHPESRFAKVAEILSVCWLHIRGSMNCRLLSRRTRYVVCIVFKLAPGSHGLGDPPQKASVKLGSYASESFIRLQPDDDDESEAEDEEEKAAVEGEDGWMEMVLGDFYTEEGDDGNVLFSAREGIGFRYLLGRLTDTMYYHLGAGSGCVLRDHLQAECLGAIVLVIVGISQVLKSS